MEELDTQWLDEVNAMEHSMDIYYKQRVQQITLTFFIFNTVILYIPIALQLLYRMHV